MSGLSQWPKLSRLRGMPLRLVSNTGSSNEHSGQTQPGSRGGFFYWTDSVRFSQALLGMLVLYLSITYSVQDHVRPSLLNEEAATPY